MARVYTSGFWRLLEDSSSQALTRLHSLKQKQGIPLPGSHMLFHRMGWLPVRLWRLGQ